MSGWTLVLTGTIAPSQKTLWKDKSQLDVHNRELEYYEAICYYITASNFEYIIFCDNSNYDFSHWKELEKLAESKNKKLELLKFQWNLIYPEKYWYWAWEQEILDYIYENSRLIHINSTWVKLTGRYIVYNINDSLKKIEKQDIYFQKYWVRWRQLQVSTLFFKVSNDFYEKYLYKKIIQLYDDIFKCKTFNLHKFTKYSYVSVEYLYYYILRDFLLRKYKTKSYVSNHYRWHSKLHYLLYDMWVSLWICDFIRYNNVLDFLLFKKIYQELINVEKNKM